MRWVAGFVGGLTVLLLLAGCGTYKPTSQPIGDNRYHIDVDLSVYDSPGHAEEYFYRRAQEIVQEQGFDSYRVLDLRSGLERAPYGGGRAFARGVIQLYRKAATAQGAAGGGA